MKSRFQPESNSEAGPPPESVLIDPEALDASEQEFAASLEDAAPVSPARFIPEPAEGLRPAASMSEAAPEATEQAEPAETAIAATQDAASVMTSAQEAAPEEPDRWRQEVAARLHQYRARRRPRAPRYPSLLLDFGPADASPPQPSSRRVPPAESRPVITREAALPVASSSIQPEIEAEPAGEPTARIIEFPAPSWEPVYRRDELAEPIFETPRILEVPETPAAPPALGGILLAPQDEPELEKRPGFEIPLQSAPLWRRWTAAGADFAIVVLALAGFGGIFREIVRNEPSLQALLAAAVLFALVFWVGYQYLLLVHAGTTPGLWLARLQVCRFDGTPAVRRVRRWRVFAGALSAAALGLGYAWSFLDEDGLCWHDRITRTYLAPGAPRPSPGEGPVAGS